MVEMIDSGDVLKLDQAHLETVIPQPGIFHLFLFSCICGAKFKPQNGQFGHCCCCYYSRTAHVIAK